MVGVLGVGKPHSAGRRCRCGFRYIDLMVRLRQRNELFHWQSSRTQRCVDSRRCTQRLRTFPSDQPSPTRTVLTASLGGYRKNQFVGLPCALKQWAEWVKETLIDI